MKKQFFGIVVFAVLLPGAVFAQGSVTSVPSDTAALIAQLQSQLAVLQAQLTALQGRATSAAGSVVVPVADVALTQTLSRGMTSAEVSDLQRFLALDPEIYPEGIVSGYYGARTEVAVKKFQSRHGLESVGVVGPKTRNLINTIGTPARTPEKETPKSSNTRVDIPVVAATTTTSSVPVVKSATTPPVAPVIPESPTNQATGVNYGGYHPGVQTFVNEPTPVPPTVVATTTQASSTEGVASSTPVVPPPPVPSGDVVGPTITSLSITPTNTVPLGPVTFSATVEDPSGIRTIIYDIKYPGSSYVLQPNCNYNGVTSGTCAYGESIDHGIQNPSLLGDYVITEIRVVDMLDNVAIYYPNGTVVNGSSPTHSLVIPAITIALPL